VVDSSGWMSFFTMGPQNADPSPKPIEQPVAGLVVPTNQPCLKVFKWILA